MFYGKLLYLLKYTHTHTHAHTHTRTYIHIHIYIYIYIFIYLFINIKNSGKLETVHWYWPVSEIYRTAGQTGTASGMILTPLTSGENPKSHFSKSKYQCFKHGLDTACTWFLGACWGKGALLRVKILFFYFSLIYF